MKENKFIIITTIYNGEEYIENCIRSISSQDYKNYEHIIVDDASTDKTSEIINKLYDENPSFKYIKNDINLGNSLENLANTIKELSKDDEDIIVPVDGDDWLNGTDVLSYLNKVYQDENVYMTYGQYEPLSHGYHNYCKQVPNFRTYRKSGLWITSHLKTFKRKIWDMVKDEDLRDIDGEYCKYANDTVFMFAMLEMCGLKHSRFIDKVLYIYNDLNPSNEMKINLTEQLRVAKMIRNKKEYDEIQ